ncbi:hypothetical protein [Sphingomonas sp. SAFR-052]
MNQRSMNLAQEVVEKTTDEAERARMEALLAETPEPIGPPLVMPEAP